MAQATQFLISGVVLCLMMGLYYGLFPLAYAGGRSGHKTIFILISAVFALPFLLIGQLSFTGQILVASVLGAPALLSFLGGSRSIDPGKIFWIAQLPLLLTLLLIIVVPSWSYWVESIIEKGLATLANSNEALPIGKDSSTWENLALVLQKLWAPLLIAELAYRLITGALLLSWFGLRGKRPLLPLFSSLKYPDWPIWTVILGLALALLGASLNGSLVWFGLGLMIIVAPLYVARGLSVCSARWVEKPMLEGRPTFFSPWLILMLLFLFTPYALLFLIGIGLADTWFDFRQDKDSMKEERTTVWK